MGGFYVCWQLTIVTPEEVSSDGAIGSVTQLQSYFSAQSSVKHTVIWSFLKPVIRAVYVCYIYNYFLATGMIFFFPLSHIFCLNPKLVFYFLVFMFFMWNHRKGKKKRKKGGRKRTCNQDVHSYKKRKKKSNAYMWNIKFHM